MTAEQVLRAAIVKMLFGFTYTEGNPADTALTETMLERQKGIYGRYPLKIALDGGFASKDNLAIHPDLKDPCRFDPEDKC